MLLLPHPQSRLRHKVPVRYRFPQPLLLFQQVSLDLFLDHLQRCVIANDGRETRWLVLMRWHHLIGDHTTLEVIQEEIQGYLLKQEQGLGEPIPYRNLVAQARLGMRQEEHEEFFREMLGEVEEPTAPFGLMDVQGDGVGIEQARVALEEDLARQLRRSARRLGVSAASLCHVAWARVLAKVSGREDVVFGTVLFGRMQGSERSEER